MHELRQEGKHHYAFSPYVEPQLSINPGETVAIYTEDAFGGVITGPDDLPSRKLGKYLNPQTGPIYINGAEPGDTLAVKIESIEPTRDWAASVFVPYFGGLTATKATRLLHEPIPERVYIYELRDDAFHYEDKWAIPWRPFLGTMATAPDLEAISALTPFDQGGNMDVRDTRPGNTLYLPVAVDGALFFTGDAHGNQGDGELCGVALEITAKATLTFDLVKGTAIGNPRIVSDTSLHAVGSARPMEDAARMAYGELIDWLESAYAMDRWDAYQLLTQAGTLYVGNMVDTNYSLVAGIEKSFLPARVSGSDV